MSVHNEGVAVSKDNLTTSEPPKIRIVICLVHIMLHCSIYTGALHFILLPVLQKTKRKLDDICEFEVF